MVINVPEEPVASIFRSSILKVEAGGSSEKLVTSCVNSVLVERRITNLQKLENFRNYLQTLSRSIITVHCHHFGIIKNISFNLRRI
jgi:hypothetical protein